MFAQNEVDLLTTQRRIADALERIATALESDRVTMVNRQDYPEAVEVTFVKDKDR